MVDNFGLKYTDKADTDLIIDALEKHYGISEYWIGILYCGIKLKWHYDNSIQNRYVDIFMPGNVTKQLKKHQHDISKRPQHSTYPSAPKKYDAAEQETIKPYDSKPSGPEGINHVKKIVGSIL